MKVFTALYGLTDAAERARALRDIGASGVASFEGPHDVFAPLTLVATVGGLDLMTNVAIAFPRNPIHLAHQANYHQLLAPAGSFSASALRSVRRARSGSGPSSITRSSDVRAMIAATRDAFTSPVVRAALPGLVADMTADAELNAQVTSRFADLFTAVRQRLREAVDRGEAHRDVDPDRLIELIGGATMLRLLLRHRTGLGRPVARHHR